eukprot:5160799-Prymnesium_polylepis.1
MLPPPRESPSGDDVDVSELRRAERARAKRDGSSMELKAAVAEWAPLLHRGFLTAGGRKRAVKRLGELAGEVLSLRLEPVDRLTSWGGSLTCC